MKAPRTSLGASVARALAASEPRPVCTLLSPRARLFYTRFLEHSYRLPAQGAVEQSCERGFAMDFADPSGDHSDYVKYGTARVKRTIYARDRRHETVKLRHSPLVVARAIKLNGIWYLSDLPSPGY